MSLTPGSFASTMRPGTLWGRHQQGGAGQDLGLLSTLLPPAPQRLAENERAPADEQRGSLRRGLPGRPPHSPLPGWFALAAAPSPPPAFGPSQFSSSGNFRDPGAHPAPWTPAASPIHTTPHSSASPWSSSPPHRPAHGWSALATSQETGDLSSCLSSVNDQLCDLGQDADPLWAPACPSVIDG